MKRQVVPYLAALVLTLFACADHHLPTETPTDLRPVFDLSPNGGPAVQVTVGGGHACALRPEGSIECWGNDFNNQTSPPFSHIGFVALSAGGAHSCAINTLDALVCWGNNDEAQAPPVVAGTYRRVSAGGSHTCAIATDSTLACWGFDGYGQASPPTGKFVEVSAGTDHTCAISDAGTLACWGRDDAGQASPPAGGFVQVSAGDRHSCGVTEQFRVACWGDNEHEKATPPSGIHLEAHALERQSCVLRGNGTVACWGGIFGTGETFAPPGTFVQIDGGFHTTCGVRTNGTVACWGFTAFIPIDVPPEFAGNVTTTTLTSSPQPSTLGEAATFTATVTMEKDGSPLTSGAVYFVGQGDCGLYDILYSVNVPVNASGQASFTTTELPVGRQGVRACFFYVDETINPSNGVTIHEIDPTGTTTTVVATPSTQQYSDRVSLTATVSGPGPTGSVQFRINGTSVGSVVLASDGTATLTDVQVTLPQGSYTVDGVFTSTNPGLAGSQGSTSVTVTREHATPLYDPSNPTALQVSSPGGSLNTGALSLAIGVQQRAPDVALPPGTTGIGDIGNAGLTVTLIPDGPGISYTLDCSSLGVSGTGATAVHDFSCSNSGPITVNSYRVAVRVAGNYFLGEHNGSLTVYDPSLGFTTGGASFEIAGESVQVTFTMKYKKGDTAKGNITIVRSHADGTTSTLNSTVLGSMAVGEDDIGRMGWSVMTGTGDYTSWSATAGHYVTVSGESFTIYVEDRGNPGMGNDRIWIGGPANLSTNGTAATAQSDAVVLMGGNISVHKKEN